jgi:hypothetical protein
MPVRLNHTIVTARDKHESATFLAEILGLPDPKPYGPFLVVEVDNDVSLDFADDHGPVHPQHYAFLVDEPEFDEISGRVKERGLRYWADPDGGDRVRSTRTTAVAACTGPTPAVTAGKSSPARTAAEADPAERSPTCTDAPRARRPGRFLPTAASSTRARPGHLPRRPGVAGPAVRRGEIPPARRRLGLVLLPAGGPALADHLDVSLQGWLV